MGIFNRGGRKPDKYTPEEQRAAKEFFEGKRKSAPGTMAFEEATGHKTPHIDSGKDDLTTIMHGQHDNIPRLFGRYVEEEEPFEIAAWTKNPKADVLKW